MVRNEELENIVEYAKQGKAEAFEQLYNSTYRFVYFHAKSMTDDKDEAWDLVQDTYMAVYRNLNTLRDNQQVKSWMSGIVRNLGCKRLRQKKVYLLSGEEEYLLQEIEEEDQEILPEEAWDKRETEELIGQAVECLPPLQRMAVIAYYFDEKKIEEIARESECSEGTIKSRLNYARKSLKEYLSQKEREMGVTLHGITGPMLFYALHRMFLQCQVSSDRAAVVWKQILVETGTYPIGTNIGTAAHSAKAVTTAGKGAWWLIPNIKAAIIVVGLAMVAGGAGAGAGIYHSRQQALVADANIPGWSEADGGLQYMLKGGEYAKGDLWLGRQVYTFGQNGLLKDIRYLDQGAFYDEDKKYYGGEGVYVSNLDGSEVQKLSDINGITKVAESEGTLYCFSQGVIYKMNTDGTELETEQNSLWYSIADMAVENGDMVFNYTDGGCSGAGTGIPRCAFIFYGADGKLYQRNASEEYSDCGCYQIQMLDGWVYYLRYEFSSEPGGTVRNNLYRMEIYGDRVQKLTNGGVTAYLVHGDKAYYMQDGELKRLNIAAVARDMEKLEGRLKDSPKQVYESYVEQVLVPQYGKITRFSGENYYEPASEEEAAIWSCGIKPLEYEPIESGILAFYVEDLDHDGTKDLAVFSVYQNTEWSLNRSMLKLQIYTARNGTIERICGEDLGDIDFCWDETEYKVAVKNTESETVFAFCTQTASYTIGDEIFANVCLKEYRDGSFVTLLDEDFTGEDDYSQMPDMLRKQGFYVSADECETRWDYLVWISDRELDTRTLIHGQGQIEPWGFEDAAEHERYRRIQEMSTKKNFRDYPIKWSIEVNE